MKKISNKKIEKKYLSTKLTISRKVSSQRYRDGSKINESVNIMYHAYININIYEYI
jgi:tetrahydrodipicolinate N-succinyltransferase